MTFQITPQKCVGPVALENECCSDRTMTITFNGVCLWFCDPCCQKYLSQTKAFDAILSVKREMWMTEEDLENVKQLARTMGFGRTFNSLSKLIAAYELNAPSQTKKWYVRYDGFAGYDVHEEPHYRDALVCYNQDLAEKLADFLNDQR